MALAAACLALEQIGLANIAAHESELTAYALEQLARVPGLWLYGDPDPANAPQRLGVIPFCIEGYDPQLVAAILSYGVWHRGAQRQLLRPALCATAARERADRL